MGKVKDHNQQFYAYFDTIEETGEVIYCGKGTIYRANSNVETNKRRGYNKFYKKIAKKYKLVRTIIPMLDEELALEYENWLMEYYHTWIDDPQATKYACNIDGPGTNGGNKKRSKETRLKQRNAKLGKKRPQKMVQDLSRPINYFTKTGVWIGWFQSIAEACHLTGLSAGNICQCCLKNKKYNHVGGYIWRYDNDFSFLTQYERHMCLKDKIKISKAVYQIDMLTNEIYTKYFSIKEATRITGITNIGRCCRGIKKSVGGYIWRYVSDVEKLDV